MSEVIRKSISLLTAIKPNNEKNEWSATEISRDLNIPVQTVHRLLSTLEEYGFVFKDKETKKFRLGMTLMQLGFSIRDNLIVRNSALSIMEKLARQTKESVYLTIPEGTDGIVVECIFPPDAIEFSGTIGLRTPLCRGASAQIILAYMNRAKKQRIMKELVNQGKVSDIHQLEKELQIARDCGLVLSIDRVSGGLCSIAAPIFSWEDKVVASISVSGPQTSFTEYTVRDMIKFTQRAAEEISEELGWLKPR